MCIVAFDRPRQVLNTQVYGYVTIRFRVIGQKLFQFLSYPTFSYFLNYQIHTQVRALLPNLFSTYYHIANKDI